MPARNGWVNADMTDMTDKTDTKTLILDAAAECFARSGSEQTSIDDIARYLSATKGKIYHHFRSKGELLSGVRMRSVQLTIDQVKPIFNVGEPPRELLRKMAFAHVRTMITELPYHRVVAENVQANEGASTTSYERKLLGKIRALQKKYQNLFRQVIEAGIADGSFRDQPVSVALHSVLILLNSPVFWYRQRDNETDADRDAISRQVAEMAYGALAPLDR